MAIRGRVGGLKAPKLSRRQAIKILIQTMLIWIGLAIVAYGFSLRKYGDDQRVSTIPLSSRSGVVESVKMNLLAPTPVEFRLVGDDTKYYITEEFVSPDVKQRISEMLKSGVSISMDNWGPMVVGLRVKSGTGGEVLQPLDVPQKQRIYYTHAAASVTDGFFVILGGIAFIILSSLLLRKVMPSRKTEDA